MEFNAIAGLRALAAKVAGDCKAQSVHRERCLTASELDKLWDGM